jgi:Aspartyl protease
LIHLGPVLTAGIAVSEQRNKALVSAGQIPPMPQQIRALVDTGAACTCVDPSVLQALNLTPTGTTLIHTPSSGNVPEPADQYDVALLIPGARPGDQPLLLPTIPVVASQLSLQGIQALIGRDILADCVLVYNGNMNQFTLAF